MRITFIGNRFERMMDGSMGERGRRLSSHPDAVGLLVSAEADSVKL
ncbi:MAG TPA: hypothetical protein VE871_02530 [Longimicrobium sp.]|nr:hypothetical protein [Longimicrobium sp.]